MQSTPQSLAKVRKFISNTFFVIPDKTFRQTFHNKNNNGFELLFHLWLSAEEDQINSNDDQASHSDEVSEEEKESLAVALLQGRVPGVRRRGETSESSEIAPKKKKSAQTEDAQKRASRNRKGTAGDREEATWN